MEKKFSLLKEDIESLNPILEINSYKTAAALLNYKLKPDLFEVEL